MRHVMSFEHQGTEFQAMELETLGVVQLWYGGKGWPWEIGHGKDIPADKTPRYVANAMSAFIKGEIDIETYNQLLPY